MKKITSNLWSEDACKKIISIPEPLNEGTIKKGGVNLPPKTPPPPPPSGQGSKLSSIGKKESR
ncbi:hypothetical protein KKE26_06350 [bacterium]|nr:hypothetical protein [bacterium]MBU1140345.1 hypothetical protein [Pseudomonadota bacterium]MBU1753307.1 hypothetical protein [bacterium]